MRLELYFLLSRLRDQDMPRFLLNCIDWLRYDILWEDDWFTKYD